MDERMGIHDFLRSNLSHEYLGFALSENSCPPNGKELNSRETWKLTHLLPEKKHILGNPISGCSFQIDPARGSSRQLLPLNMFLSRDDWGDDEIKMRYDGNMGHHVIQ